MDNMQPWDQMRQGFNGQGIFQQRPFNRVPPGQSQGQSQEFNQPAGQQTTVPPSPQTPDTTRQVEWLSGLSREEKLEAKRLEIQASFSFEGYQVVRREFISHQFDPAMTIRGTSITFNSSCISKLENATYIHFLINPTEMRLLIRAVSEGARDAIRWCIVKGDKRKSREITCKPFTKKLYEMMQWDPMYRYKMQGMKITCEGEDMYLFDLKAVECFIPQHRDPVTGKIPKAEVRLPDAWAGRDSYGMTVAEHALSTQVDLESGFTEASMEPESGEITQADSPAATIQADNGQEDSGE